MQLLQPGQQVGERRGGQVDLYASGVAVHSLAAQVALLGAAGDQERGLSIERVDSDATGVQVNLAPAPFANLLAWLQQLQAEGVRFADVSLERGDNGRVLARLSLAVSG